MSTLFLSYARQDAVLVQALAADLRALGNTVWIDEEVSGGQAWWDHILEQIRACDVFVFALSPAAFESSACGRESEYAAVLGKPVLPIWLLGEEPPYRLTPTLAHIQYVDYRERTTEASLRLARALNHMPTTPPLPEPLPKSPESPISYINQLAAQITGDAPLNYEAQSALVLELKRSLANSDMAEDARVLLTQLRERRDLLARIDKEILEALGIISAATERPNRLTTILLTIALTLASLGLVTFFFGDALLDIRLRRLRQQLNSIQQERSQERNELQQLVSELQAKVSADEKKTQEKSITSGPFKFYVNTIGMEFVLIPKGTFDMGSNNGENDEQPVHRVTISKPFYLGKSEVTQTQWKLVMGSDNNPSEFKGDKLPVTNVSWDDVQQFIEKLNAKEGTSAYRLPTEAEWEYAARAGTTTAYSFGEDPTLLGQYAWYDKNSGGKTHSAGQLKANLWGLHDMHGNVWEWVEDWYVNQYSTGHQTDPKGPKEGKYRVARGGSIFYSHDILRSTSRVKIWPEARASSLGFRCVLVLLSLKP